METLHVKLDAEEAINSRRNFLYAEMSLIKLIKKLQDFKRVRSLEFKAKILLKVEIKKLELEIIELRKKLPKAKIHLEGVEIETGLGRATRAKLEFELKEIKEELKKLSG